MKKAKVWGRVVLDLLIIVLVLGYLGSFFMLRDDGSLIFSDFFTEQQTKETPVAESACRGTAPSDYVSTWDGKTYPYKCDEVTGLWGYTDRFSDPSCNLIKGNIAVGSNEKIYHVRGQAYYDDTRIDPEYGERAFCSEQEAINAGWRKSYK